MRLRNVSVRLADEDVGRLEALAKRFGGIMAPSALARAAVQLGLDRLEAEGAKALEVLGANARKGRGK